MAILTSTASSGQFSTLAISVSVLALVVVLIQRYLAVQKDDREPPFVPSKIPIVGHLLHIIREGADYYGRLDRRYNLGLYTLPMLSGRMYIVASPEWATAVHRAHKTIQFNTLIAQAMKNLFCLDEATMDLINDNLNGQNGTRDGIMFEVHDMMQATLAPGPHLDALNKSILDKVAADFNTLAREPVQIKLWEWLRYHFSLASVSAIWGPKSPFSKDPEIESAFWEFEAAAMPLTMMPFPRIFARKGYKARQRIFRSFEEYMENEDFRDPGTSELVQNRAKINMGKFNMSKKMHAWGDVSLLFGALVNTIPATFWLVSWIFEDKELLREIREEVDQCITTQPSDPNKRIINATKLRASCPIFSSAPARDATPRGQSECQ